MTQAVKPNQMKLLLSAAGILSLVLRAVLYTSGVDHKGLLTAGYWADTAVWILTAGAAAILLLWCCHLPDCKKASPRSVFSAAGAALAAIGVVLSPVIPTPSETFAAIELVLRFASAASLIYISYCRFQGRAPLFLCHCAVCLYLALRLVCQYRIWSSDPQIQNYAFYMGAHIALMITAYQFAALDAGYGSLRQLWGTGLASVYLSTASIPGSGDPFFLVCCTLWIFTNLSCPASLKSDKTSNEATQEESQ